MIILSIFNYKIIHLDYIVKIIIFYRQRLTITSKIDDTIDIEER